MYPSRVKLLVTRTGRGVFNLEYAFLYLEKCNGDWRQLRVTQPIASGGPETIRAVLGLYSDFETEFVRCKL